jgi:amino acid adenylation domain-containing protein
MSLPSAPDLAERIARLSPAKRALLEHKLRERDADALRNELIPRRAKRDTAPLSFGQQRLYFLDQLEPGNTAYNVPRAIRIYGSLDVAALEKVLEELLRRHESLRARFREHDGRIIAEIAPTCPFSLSIVEIGAVACREREAEALRLAEQEAERPFDLARGPLLRATLLRLDPQDHVLLLTMHHIASDAWSAGVLFHELNALYEVFSAGISSSLPDLPIQYGDFAQWQSDWLEGEVLEQQLSYWREQLADLPVLELPTDRPRPALQSRRGALQSVRFSRELTEALRELSRREGVTLFMTLLAAYQTLLSRYCGQDEIVVGTPILNRSRPDIEGVIGFFVNTVVLRTDLSGNPTFRELLGRVREVALGAYAHPDLPFEKLVEELRPERNLGQNPLFQTMLALNYTPSRPLALGGLRVEHFEIRRRTSMFDLSISFDEEPQGLSCFVEYSTDLFDPSTVTRLGGHLRTLLGSVVTDPDQRVATIPILTEPERRQVLVEWNETERAYPQDKTVHRLFEEQAERMPEAVAVELAGKRLTYGELNRRSNQLARHLRGLGVGPEVLVGLCVERSLEMVVGLLGILKAGGAYLPLDPAYPRERLRFMLEESGAHALLTHQAAAGSCPPLPARTLLLDASWEIPREGEGDLDSGISPQNLAYLIYTSGSTGKPKGVEIEHGSLSNYVRFAADRFGLRTGERILQFASLSFDTAAEEIFSALSAGATLVLRSEEMIETVATFLARCRECNLTVVGLPTSYWHELVAVVSTKGLSLPESLRLVVIGGERALPERLAQWREMAGNRVQLLNAYGPTEATVAATFWEPSTGLEDSLRRTVPIGRPIPNVRVYVLGASLEPVPVGVQGELYIGGAGLARGYRNRPELTAERFIPDPFRGGKERIYRTGDRVRFCPGGNLEYVGRVDEQVKLRGFRVEPAEVETALREIAGVREAVVRAREDAPGQARLVGYIVPDPARPPSVGDLRRLLREKLPEYMVPSTFVLLDAVPRTRSGKLDAASLPAPEPARPELDNTYCGPRTPMEETLTEIWMTVLRVDRVGVQDDFFELGGHSLLATRVISRARDAFQVELPLRDLFLNPTVAELAMAIAERQAERVAPGELERLLSELESAARERSPDGR